MFEIHKKIWTYKLQFKVCLSCVENSQREAKLLWFLFVGEECCMRWHCIFAIWLIWAQCPGWKTATRIDCLHITCRGLHWAVVALRGLATCWKNFVQGPEASPWHWKFQKTLWKITREDAMSIQLLLGYAESALCLLFCWDRFSHALFRSQINVLLLINVILKCHILKEVCQLQICGVIVEIQS